jgi:nucleotidyltransferase substrate binding protein (TIGR01987 family)
MLLDLEALKKALNVLERSLAVSHSEERMAPLDKETREVVRMGAVQGFEMAYEVSWKYIKRWIEAKYDPAIVGSKTRRGMFILAAENRLIDDVQRWMDFNQARNETAHTYDPDAAEGVFSEASAFLVEAQKLLAVLEANND